ncbi:single-stranded DNA-binding protein [Nesterenkonia alkaliphila]|uniref:Single-stranded DNA-binding protein n=1 Tax=Nesterenkonia alkaliphila TaxID=1463631 RepID=A0A7K1UG39_9MICC|nr:hypothetical protein [Nesterenkonia alkaliphila]MVT25061.1 hypothetical protein [Nesterenkonia alkaliphila]GFZ83249.1 hypothetical protein GCM10011359_10000 [Nesterenkonia alkaliphila]
MDIPTKPSLSGFIKSTPRLTRTNNGNPRFFAWTGVPRSEYLGDGTYRELEPVDVPLVMFGASAERAHEQFRKGDNFIAEGKADTWTRQVDGQQIEEQQFVASRIGHDNNITTYSVERRAPEQQVERDTAARDAVGAQVDGAEATRATSAPTATAAAAPVPATGNVTAEPPAAGAPGDAREPTGVQAQVAEVLAQREAQVAAEPEAMPGPAQPARESVSR